MNNTIEDRAIAAIEANLQLLLEIVEYSSGNISHAFQALCGDKEPPCINLMIGLLLSAQAQLKEVDKIIETIFSMNQLPSLCSID